MAREWRTWFLVVAGALLVLVGVHLLPTSGALFQENKKSTEVTFTIAAGVLFLIGSQLYSKGKRIRNSVLLVLGVMIVSFPSFVESKPMFLAWIAVGAIQFILAVCESFRPQER